MSRVVYGEDSVLYGLWEQAVQNAINGKKGQKNLRDLERYLLAMPERRLINELATAEGGTCLVGEFCVGRQVDHGKLREQAVRELAAYAGEGESETLYRGELAGLQRCLAWTLEELNDERWGQATPERRWELALEWVRDKLGEWEP